MGSMGGNPDSRESGSCCIDGFIELEMYENTSIPYRGDGWWDRMVNRMNREGNWLLLVA